ncbi:enoyl-CoA hydratase/isomerase family protein [Natronorubrum sp. FCH18a]|uniref:enoyl-CoA hydratase/isomerase family protein n=1 Tax=Natronorubrum sp. FCH18a TaxID=3447018 RepID=UPI003F51153E
MEYIDASVEDGIGTITLQRYDETRNAFDDKMKYEIIKTLEEYRDNDAVRVILFRSEGDVFSSGGDLSEGGEDTHSLRVIKQAADDWETLFMTMVTLEKPTIAAVDGDAIAGAVDFLIFTDFVIAKESVEFILPEIYMSHIDWFNVAMLPHLVGVKQALDFIMTGGPITASEAEAMGLITDAVPDDAFEENIDDLTSSLKQATPTMLQKVKESIYASANMSPASAYMYTKQASMKNLRENADFKEGFDAQYQQREPEWSE